MAQHNEELAEGLASIKKLMILALVKSGLTQTEIARALGIDQTTVARMFPKNFLNNLKKGGS